MRHILFKYPQTIENYTEYICCWDSSGPKVWLQAWMCHYLNLNFVIFMKSRSPWWVIISWSHKMKFTKSQNLMFNGETNPGVWKDVGCYLFIWFSLSWHKHQTPGTEWDWLLIGCCPGLDPLIDREKFPLTEPILILPPWYRTDRTGACVCLIINQDPIEIRDQW